MANYPAVLYVEDDAKSRTIMDVLLTEHLSLEQVIIFEDSSNFKQNIAALPFRPDIIFLDIHMEPIDGFRMLDLLQNELQFGDIPVVALTASVMNEEVQQLRESGFNGVISKPINIMTFPGTLQQLLDGEEVWRVVNR